MEGKTVIMTTLLLSLILGKIQVEAIVCCPSDFDYVLVDECINFEQGSVEQCASKYGCPIILGTDKCPNTGDNAVNEYCKLGCVSSMCGAITTLQNSDASEVVNGAIEKCTKACSTLCTKGSITAVETA